MLCFFFSTATHVTVEHTHEHQHQRQLVKATQLKRHTATSSKQRSLRQATSCTVLSHSVSHCLPGAKAWTETAHTFAGGAHFVKPCRVPTAGRVLCPLVPKVFEKSARPPWCSYRWSRAGKLGISARRMMYSSASMKPASAVVTRRAQAGVGRALCGGRSCQRLLGSEQRGWHTLQAKPAGTIAARQQLVSGGPQSCRPALMHHLAAPMPLSAPIHVWSLRWCCMHQSYA